MLIIPDGFKRIFRNFFSLNLVQLTNIVFPLIVLPYVVRVIGVGKFGLVSFVQSFIMYFVFISDYGFSVAGTREISLNKNDSYKLSEIFYSIFILKLILGTICLSIILILINNSNFFGNNRILYLISTGILFGSIFFPQWFFQGIEKMETIPLINISLKVVQLILIFSLVKTETDYILYFFIIAATQLLIGLIGFIVSLGILKYKLFFPGFKSMSFIFKKAFTFFSTSLGLNIFNNSNTFIVGMLGGEHAAGIFSAADKIRLSLQGIISSFIMSVFPAAVQKAHGTKNKFIPFFRKTFIASLIIGIFIGVNLFIFSKDVVTLLLGPAFNESIVLVKLFSIVIITFAAGEIFGYIVLLPYQYEKIFNKIVWIGVILHLMLLLILVHNLSEIGAVYSVITTEVILTAACASAVLKRGLVKNNI